MPDSPDPDRQTTYEAVIDCVEYNTDNEQQGPTVSLRELHIILVAHSRHNPNQVDLALRAAEDNGELCRLESGEDTVVLPRSSDSLVTTIENAVAQDPTDRELVAQANQVLQEIRS